MTTLEPTELLKQFKSKCSEIFHEIQQQAANVADRNYAIRYHFTAVMKAATELVINEEDGKNQDTPKFASHRQVDIIWSVCVAYVCSNQILQQVGGAEGHNLVDLAVTDLLDVIAWVEYFGEAIQNEYSIDSDSSGKPISYEPPTLFNDESEVNQKNMNDVLEWANNIMWEVHRLSQDELLLRTRSKIHELLTKVYKSDHEIYQLHDMRLRTSLCENVFAVVDLHLNTVCGRLDPQSDAIQMVACLIFSQLRLKHINSRDRFLNSFESCCAAANDFQRMSEQTEIIANEIKTKFSENSRKILEETCNTLVALFVGDAVFAAQKVHYYIFQPLQESVADDFFGLKWETESTDNEYALILIKTLDDFIVDLESFMDELMCRKALNTIVVATVLLYTKCLLAKAQRHDSYRSAFFKNSHVALERMEKDVMIIKAFFNSFVERMPSLGNIIEREFQLLVIIQELMRIASGISDVYPKDFIIMLYKCVKDTNVTKRIVGDLWHLVQPRKEKGIRKLTNSMNETLNTLRPHEKQKIDYDLPELRVDQTLAKFYKQNRKRSLSPVRRRLQGLSNKNKQVIKRLEKVEIDVLLTRLCIE